MIRVQILPAWKRAVIALQLITLPIWLLPVCLWIGLKEIVPDIPWLYQRGWQLITARNALEAEGAGRG